MGDSASLAFFLTMVASVGSGSSVGPFVPVVDPSFPIPPSVDVRPRIQGRVYTHTYMETHRPQATMAQHSSRAPLTRTHTGPAKPLAKSYLAALDPKAAQRAQQPPLGGKKKQQQEQKQQQREDATWAPPPVRRAPVMAIVPKTPLVPVPSPKAGPSKRTLLPPQGTPSKGTVDPSGTVAVGEKQVPEPAVTYREKKRVAVVRAVPDAARSSLLAQDTSPSDDDGLEACAAPHPSPTGESVGDEEALGHYPRDPFVQACVDRSSKPSTFCHFRRSRGAVLDLSRPHSGYAHAAKSPCDAHKRENIKGERRHPPLRPRHGRSESDDLVVVLNGMVTTAVNESFPDERTRAERSSLPVRTGPDAAQRSRTWGRPLEQALTVPQAAHAEGDCGSMVDLERDTAAFSPQDDIDAAPTVRLSGNEGVVPQTAGIYHATNVRALLSNPPERPSAPRWRAPRSLSPETLENRFGGAHACAQMGQHIGELLAHRAYGLSFEELVAIVRGLSNNAQCTVREARDVALTYVPGAVARRMFTPWYRPRFSVALSTPMAVERCVAPDVRRALDEHRNGMDVRHLDHRLIMLTGVPLRVHAINFAGNSILTLLAMMPHVVSRIEDIGGRLIVYPAGHARDMRMFAPLVGDEAHGPDESDDALVERLVGHPVRWVDTMDEARALCAMVRAQAQTHIVFDCRGVIGGRHTRGQPVGMIQLALPGHPIYQMDMIALGTAWTSQPSTNSMGNSLTYMYASLGLSDLLCSRNVVKIVYDAAAMNRSLLRRTNVQPASVLDLRECAYMTGAHTFSVRYLNDALAHFGLSTNPDNRNLVAMASTDCWAWHRRPVPLRARVAAARDAVIMSEAYDAVRAKWTHWQQSAAPVSDRPSVPHYGAHPREPLASNVPARTRSRDEDDYRLATMFEQLGRNAVRLEGDKDQSLSTDPARATIEWGLLSDDDDEGDS